MAGLFEKLMYRLGKRPASEVAAEIETAVNSAKQYIERYRANVEEIAKQRKLLELMAHHMGGLVWIKRWDAEQRAYLYEFANRTHCDLFFRFEPECLEDCTSHVSGKSDVDILNEYRERTKKRHSFGEMCVSTDVHSTEQAILHYDSNGLYGSQSCRYLECGYIGEKPFVLEVVKTPLFNLEMPCKCWGSHTYTVGNALEVTDVCESRIKHAMQCVELGQGKKLQDGVYWMFPTPKACDLLKVELPEEN